MFAVPKLAAALLLLSLALTGCGTAGTTLSQPRALQGFSAKSATGLLEGFNQVYRAAFLKADANRDQQVDEFEAGPFIDVRDFRRADSDRNGKLSEKEFLMWGTRGGLFGLFRQDAKSFARTYRNALLKAFRRLDTDRNQLLTPAELNDGALEGAQIALHLKGIRTSVRITTVDDLAFRSADKTNDGFLSQGEFEDFAIAAWVELIQTPAQAVSSAPPATGEPTL